MTIELPVFQTTKDALGYCWHERRALMRFGAVPFGLSIAIAFAAQAMGIGGPGDSFERMGLSLALATVWLPMIATWYRMVVRGEAEARTRPFVTWGRPSRDYCYGSSSYLPSTSSPQSSPPQSQFS